METKTLPPANTDEEPVVTGDPTLDLPPWTGEGEDLAAKWYGAWKGLFPDLSLGEWRELRDEWSREAEIEREEYEAEERREG